MMYCPRCGAQNDVNNVRCGSCGTFLREAGIAPPPVRIPNYLVPAILVTVLCCLPFGIVAIVYAAQVNARIQGGNLEGAREASKNARMWCWISLAAGLAAGAIYAALMVMGMVSGL